MVISFCMILTACQSVDKDVEKNDKPKLKEESAVIDNSETEAAEEEETGTTELDETGSADQKARYAIYKNVMLDFSNNHDLLGLGDISEAMKNENISDNKFALVDVDADGQEELLVYFITTAVASHMGVIYDYNDETGECYIKFQGYPLLSFYENGTIEEGWSHNQGYAGDFWPYTLHVYDKEMDRYNTVSHVDAYDRALYENNQDGLADSPFPYDIDMDGNGFVYYMYSNEDNLSDYQEIPAVDDDLYQAWLEEYTEGTKKLELTFYSVTKENINEILDIE